MTTKNDIGRIKYTGDFMEKAKEARERSAMVAQPSRPTEVNVTVIAVLADGTQLVASGIKGFVAARAHIKQRIATQKYPGATMRYTRFIVIGTAGFANGVHMYDDKGKLYKEFFL